MLNNVSILNTRPKQQAQSLTKKLRELEADVIELPTLVIEPLNNELSIDLSAVDILIFISPNAVTTSIGQNKLATIPKQCAVVSMGSGTTQALQHYNVKPTIEPKPGTTSESLLTLPIFQDVQNKTILLIAGEGGRKVLMDGLLARGAEVVKYSVYKRTAPVLDCTIDCSVEPDVIISTSGESLQNLAQILENQNQQKLFAKPLLIISQRMVKLAEQLGFTGPVLIAQGASDQAISERLVQWKTQS